MKLVITGFSMVGVALLAIILLFRWAFTPLAENTTGQLSDAAPRISAILPIVHFGLITIVAGLVICLVGESKRKKAKRAKQQNEEFFSNQSIERDTVRRAV